jgi:hypothetical protein
MAAAGGKPSDFDAYQGVCLLKIMGFMEDGDALAITFRGDSREGVRSETVLVVSQAGRVPDGATTRFVAMSPPSAPGQMALLFESADARDIMAFALAVENSMAARTGHHGRIPDEDRFSAGGRATHNPFADSERGDWIHDPAASSPVAIHLRNPAGTYGEAYLKWRDARAGEFVREKPACGFRFPIP